MPSSSSFTKEDAIREVENILKQKDSLYHLVSFQRFQNGKNLRSERYNFFDVLCHVNTLKRAGWLVCKYAATGGCKLSNAFLIYNTSSGGTGRLARHISQHKTTKCGIMTLPKQLPHMSKAHIARCAALAVALDLRPLSFTDNERGLEHFVGAIFNLGQATTENERIDPKSLLPCTKTLSSVLNKLADDNREEYRFLLPEMIKVGGGLTIDVVTLKVQDKQFYDLTIHFLTVACSSPFDRSPDTQMSCRTLLLEEKKGGGSGEQIRDLLHGALKKHYDCDIEKLTSVFTMVTDNASVMARAAGSSVSARVAPVVPRLFADFPHIMMRLHATCTL